MYIKIYTKIYICLQLNLYQQDGNVPPLQPRSGYFCHHALSVVSAGVVTWHLGAFVAVCLHHGLKVERKIDGHNLWFS